MSLACWWPLQFEPFFPLLAGSIGRGGGGNHTNIDVIGHTCDASYICIWDRSAPPWVGEGGSTDSQMRHYLKPGTILASIHLRLHLGEGSYRVVFSNDTDGFGSFFF